VSLKRTTTKNAILQKCVNLFSDNCLILLNKFACTNCVIFKDILLIFAEMVFLHENKKFDVACRQQESAQTKAAIS